MPVEVQVNTIIMGAVAFSSPVWATVHLKIKKRELELRSGDTELGPVVDALRGDLEQLADLQEHTQTQLAEVQERLDFAERVLTAGRESQEDRGE